MKTLYLHIGTPKTGTTAIQHFCHDNMHVLAGRGYYYPDMPFEYPNRGKYRNGMFLEGRCIKEDGERDIEMEQQNLREGFRLINEHFKTYDNIILSDEGIWSRCFNRKHWAEICKSLTDAAEEGGYTIKIIVYLRRQDELLLSWYNQMVKHSVSIKKNSLTWEEYYGHYSKYLSLNYLRCLNKLTDIFGKENIIVKRFDKGYFYKNSLFADFLNIFGIELTEGFVIEEGIVNTKISENACEIKRIINDLEVIDIEEMRKYEQILIDLSEDSERDYPCCRMSGEEREEFMKLYELSNKKLVKKYIGDDKPLFNDLKSVKEKFQRDNPYLINDLIRFVFLLDVYNSRELMKQKSVIYKLKTKPASNSFYNKIKAIVKAPFRKQQ